MTTDYFALERVLEQSGDFDDDYLIDLIHKRYAALSARVLIEQRQSNKIPHSLPRPVST